MTQTPDMPIPYICVMDDAQQDFAALIRDARQRKGWSQDDLEASSGVNRSTLSRWERGLSDRPEPENVRAVCISLGIDPRRAAVALGYLTAEEVGPIDDVKLDPRVEEIMQVLEDPAVPEEEKLNWIEYLKYLRLRHNRSHRNAS